MFKAIIKILVRSVLPVVITVSVILLSYDKTNLSIQNIQDYLKELFHPFVYSIVMIIPSIILSYILALIFVFQKKTEILLYIAAMVTSFPIFIISITSENVIWINFFSIISYHDPIKDFISTFIPSFTTFFVVVFFTIFINLDPNAVLMKKKEFVRTYRSIGLDEKVINKRLKRNLNAEFSRILLNLIPIFLGESIVVENVFNFRGIGYELIQSIKSLEVNRVISLSLYFSLVLLGIYAFSWWVGEKWLKELS